jgi:hypothetical protein
VSAALHLVPVRADDDSTVAVWVPEDGAAVRYLTRDRARQLTDATRVLLGQAGANLVELRAGSAHLALDYPDWHTYVEAEFGELAVYKLVKERQAMLAERDALVASLTLAGHTIREQREKLGASLDTIHRTQRRLGLVPDKPSPVVDEEQPEPADPFRGLQRTPEVLARVAAQGDRGLTSLELDQETGWPMGTATGLLSRLERGRDGRGGGLLAFGEGLRNRRMPYVITAAGRARLAEVLAARDAAEAQS